MFPLALIPGSIGKVCRKAIHVRAHEEPPGNCFFPSFLNPSHKIHSVRLLVVIGLASSALTLGSRASDSVAATNSVERLKSLTLEDVLNTPITSVLKRSENSFQAAAAVSVISHDDIARSGARSIPEALRLAPGMTIASMDSHTWAVSSRGLTDLLSDRLLVLIDGRTVYSPLFAGVFWDLQNYPLEDIDRIEVVRGPGGTLWGANAVNGVVNIITRNSKETLGTYFTSGVGTVERAFFDARYGASLSDDLTARAYFSGYKRENFQGGFDDSQNLQGGFRTDWSREQTTITLQGDYYHSEGDQRVIYGTYAGYTPNQGFPLTESTFPGDGGNILGRFFHSFSEDSDIQLQAYYDRVDHNFLGSETLQEIYNVEWQQRFNLPLNQNLTYGLGYRYLPDSVASGKNFIPVPNSLGRQDFNGLVQDEVQLVPDRLRLTLGSKIEHNDYTGFEFQPTVRLAWLITPKHTLWAAVSRAVQVPSRLDHDSTTPEVDPSVYPMQMDPTGATLIPVFSAGTTPQGTGTKVQELVAYELGYRGQLRDNLAIDITGFYNDYSHFLIADYRGMDYLTSPYQHYLLHFHVINGGYARTFGFESTMEWRATDRWRIVGTYSLLIEHLDDTVANFSVFGRGRDPGQQVSLRSSWDLPHDLQVDLWGRYVDELPYFPVKAYFNLDARLSWHPWTRLEIAIVGKNLIEGNRMEFGSESFLPTQVTAVPRSAYLQLTYRY